MSTAPSHHKHTAATPAPAHPSGCAAMHTPSQKTAPATFIPLALVALSAGRGNSQDPTNGVGGASRVSGDRGHLGDRSRGGCKARTGSQSQDNTGTRLPKSHQPPWHKGGGLGLSWPLWRLQLGKSPYPPQPCPVQNSSIPQQPSAGVGAEAGSAFAPLTRGWVHVLWDGRCFSLAVRHPISHEAQ